ncbi:MAG TPA: penicillin-binding transpeptidase domain-containing protein [Bacillota bacterium]|nr:penicillin-binding transpeptidase domain-containing protein [Bacillota bacterium]
MRKETLRLMVLLTICLLFGSNQYWVGATAGEATSQVTPVQPVGNIAKAKSEIGDSMASLDLRQYFQGYDGCFVLYDLKKHQYLIYNEPKSKKPVPPCSTFKILNALICLETGVIPDERATTKWDGTRYSIESWNKDQNLNSAIANSVVWYFQKAAVKVGPERMQQYLDRVNYGNKDISAGIDRFWLQASLQISPQDQVAFLRKFYAGQLPFSKRNIELVKMALVLKNEPGIKLSGKTGSGMKDGQPVNGWFVGYVEQNDNVLWFATNLEGNGASGMVAQWAALKILNEHFKVGI